MQCESPRVFRRLQLLGRLEHCDQDDEQVFPEVPDRAVRLVLDDPGQPERHWSAMLSISSKVSCAPPTLNEWGKKAEVDREDGVGIDLLPVESAYISSLCSGFDP